MIIMKFYGPALTVYALLLGIALSKQSLMVPMTGTLSRNQNEPRTRRQHQNDQMKHIPVIVDLIELSGNAYHPPGKKRAGHRAETSVPKI